MTREVASPTGITGRTRKRPPCHEDRTAGERGRPSGLSIASLGSALNFVTKGPLCSSLRFSFLFYEVELASLSMGPFRKIQS